MAVDEGRRETAGLALRVVRLVRGARRPWLASTSNAFVASLVEEPAASAPRTAEMGLGVAERVAVARVLADAILKQACPAGQQTPGEQAGRPSAHKVSPKAAGSGLSMQAWSAMRQHTCRPQQNMSEGQTSRPHVLSGQWPNQYCRRDGKAVRSMCRWPRSRPWSRGEAKTDRDAARKHATESRVGSEERFNDHGR